MAREVVTADPGDPIEEAANTMREQKIGCLPVLEGEELVGIITSSDVMEALVYLVGAHEPGNRLEVAMPDRPGIAGWRRRGLRDLRHQHRKRRDGGRGNPAMEAPSGAHSGLPGGHHGPQRGGRRPGGGGLLRPVAAQTLSGRAVIVHDLALEDYGFGGEHPFNPLRIRLDAGALRGSRDA